MNICIIPARAGSKRILNKNIREFCGKPIIEYAIETALTVFEKPIIVYTNDKKIIEKYPEHVELRPDKNADDNATLTDTLLEIPYLQHYDNICLLLPTAVFTTSEDLIKSHELLKDNDAVISVCKYSHPVERSFYKLNDDNTFSLRFPEFEFTRTQDLPESFYDAGQFYWLNTESFLKQKKIFMNKKIPYIMDAVDIDTESDWIKAEAIYGV